jgi:16S rRNA (uracil1498-N3)-methyltransferase
VAIAACEQCGRNRVPTIYPVQSLAHWLNKLPLAASPGGQVPQRIMLSLRETSRPLMHFTATASPLLLLHGPEGGLSPHEENSAIAQGFGCASLGNRVLRAETAALAALAIASISA